jgi:hypothetical protein
MVLSGVINIVTLLYILKTKRIAAQALKRFPINLRP